MDTAICLFVFNRPGTTAQVIRRVAEVRPKRLYVVADGPRESHADDVNLCRQTRAAIDGIDWPCRVEKNYADVNLGLKGRVVSGLDWLFEREEQAIILEDDCLADPSFFLFCEELLTVYRHDERVMSISGSNFQPAPVGDASYYFGRIPHIWGWATWRRAWACYDAEMSAWPRMRSTDFLYDAFGRQDAVAFWRAIFDDSDSLAATWDYQWVFACLKQGALTASPNLNLVSNIGFGPDATHTTDLGSGLANMPVYPMRFPLRHPSAIGAARVAQEFTLNSVFGLDQASTYTRVAARARRLFLHVRSLLSQGAPRAR